MIVKNLYGSVFTVFVLSSASVVTFIYYRSFQMNPNQGWKTAKEFRQPFQNSIITNGCNPADFEIVLLNPDSNLTRIEKNSNIEVEVSVNFTDNSAVNNDLAPTDVSVILRKDKLIVSSESLDPYARAPLSFVYKGLIEVPHSQGDYQLSVEAKFSIYDFGTSEQAKKGGRIPMPTNTFRKIFQGVKVHVGN